MDITENNFRDNVIKEITIGYDWNSAENYALIKIIDADKSINRYRITGLKEYNLYEDFQAMHIEQCKLVNDSNNVYLCLDPFDEAKNTKDKDNFYFIGQSIKMVKLQR